MHYSFIIFKNTFCLFEIEKRGFQRKSMPSYDLFRGMTVCRLPIEGLTGFLGVKNSSSSYFGM